MLQIRIDINNDIRFLDLFDDENIELELSVNEIQDITQKNSGFTKSFKLPGSKNNNDIFNYFFDVNSNGIDYDLSSKMNARIIYKGYDILIGNIRLDEVTISDGEIVYGVTFYNQVGDLASNISDKTLKDVDYSSLSHDYTSVNIFNSLLKDPSYALNIYDNPNVWENGKVYYPLMHYGYEYDENNEVNRENTPLLEFGGGDLYGYFDNTQTPLPYYYFKPAVQVRELYELIVNQAGYTLTSDFFDTSYFKRYYLPFTFSSEDLYLNQAERPYFEVLSEDPIYATSGVTYPAGGTVVDLIRLEDVLQNEGGLSNIPTDYFSITATSTGQYSGFIRIQAINPESGDPTYQPDAKYRVRIFEGNVISGQLVGNYQWTSATITLPTASSGITEFDFTFNAIETRKYYFTLEDDLGTVITDILGYRIVINLGPPSITNPIDLSKEVSDEYKQIDFITSINRLFNLVVVPNPEKEDDLIIEPVIDYYGTGEVLDWTDKVDRSKSITIRPTTMFSDGSLNYELKEDKDYANQEFKKLTNKTFGTDIVKLNSNYKDNEKKFDYIFSNIVDDVVTTPTSPYMTIPVSNIQKQQEKEGNVLNLYTPYRSLPRLIFRTGHIPMQNMGLNEGIKFFYGSGIYEYPGLPLVNRVTTYPSKVEGLSHFINFNDTHRFNNLEEDFTGIDTLYDIYYKDFVEELNNSENRFVTLTCYLTPYEIKNLKWNERIIIDNTYYRLNKISKYNLVQPDLAQVELIKEIRSFRNHPKACFKLTNCETGDYDFVTTDQSYLIYQFNGRTLRRYIPPFIDYCVSVEQVDCDCVEEDKLFDMFNLDDYIFSSSQDIYRTYDNCSDCLADVNIKPTIDYYNTIDTTLPSCEPVPPTTTTTTTIPPVEYNYYRVEECYVPEGYWIIQTTQTLNIGQAVKISINPDLCYEVTMVEPPIPPTATLLQVYDNCDACSSGSTTTTTTTTQFDCVTYQVCPPTGSGESIEVEYVNCDGITTYMQLYWTQLCTNICAVDGTPTLLSTGPGGSLTRIGNPC